jgi:hypothetical protein
MRVPLSTVFVALSVVACADPGLPPLGVVELHVSSPQDPTVATSPPSTIVLHDVTVVPSPTPSANGVVHWSVSGTRDPATGDTAPQQLDFTLHIASSSGAVLPVGLPPLGTTHLELTVTDQPISFGTSVPELSVRDASGLVFFASQHASGNIDDITLTFGDVVNSFLQWQTCRVQIDDHDLVVARGATSIALGIDTSQVLDGTPALRILHLGSRRADSVAFFGLGACTDTGFVESHVVIDRP